MEGGKHRRAGEADEVQSHALLSPHVVRPCTNLNRSIHPRTRIEFGTAGQLLSCDNAAMIHHQSRITRKNGSRMVGYEWSHYHTSFSGLLNLWFSLPSLLTSHNWKGLCAYVLANVPNASTRGIVIGHDHRYNSERWSKMTAAIFASRKIRVYHFRGHVHTPL